MFAHNPMRFDQFSIASDALLFDYSKNRIDAPCFSALVKLARDADIEARREAMFSGKVLNVTEDRSVLHTALRSCSTQPLIIHGHNIRLDIAQNLARMHKFASQVRQGQYRISNAPISDIVNIGIGGSNLGPSMAAQALTPYCDGPELHFVSNIDGADIHDCLAKLNLSTTLFIVASKTFTTLETMTNAKTVRNRLVCELGESNIGAHFVALSANLEATRAFGIDDERTFEFWDWVGGRYSVWSSIGLSLMIGMGPKNFDDFLAGGAAIDRHFCKAPLHENIPVIMALLGIWYRNILDFSTYAILPYDQRLSKFPAYLQQVDMESNGKQVRSDGKKTHYATGPILWGDVCTNGQHAFFQSLHQGSDIIPADFLIAAESHESISDHHEKLLANCLAQSEALMIGKSKQEVLDDGANSAITKFLAPHKTFYGNRPTNTLLYNKLTPSTLGKLIALYEHKIFVQGSVWGINSFDQWGVELGKQLAEQLLPMIRNEANIKGKNTSTEGLLKAIHQFRKLN